MSVPPSIMTKGSEVSAANTPARSAWDAEEEGERAVAVVVGVRENGSEIYRCEMVGRVDHLHDEAERFGVLGDSRAGDRVASSFFEREENHDAGRESGRMVGG